MSDTYLIIGNGVAGVTAAEILRNENSAADITVIADDPFPVYYRPALKDYLAGRVREDKLWARPTSFYQDARIRFLSERVVGIQAGQHIVQLASGREVGYGRLLLANGARASRLSCPGLDLIGVTTLRTVADYQQVVNQLASARRVIVSGSGTLALETIETLRHRGYSVTHLLRKRTLWSEVLDATASDLVLQQEKRDGVDVRLEDEVAEITGKDGKVTGILTTSGARIPCDMVLMAIGVEPIIDFVKKSGIGCGRGIKVDGHMRTDAPDIYAAGDVLETADATTGRTRIIGQWYPAIQQARAAAYSMLDLLDTNRPFRSSTFYNATFLYGLDFASAGLTQIPKDGQGYQEIVADPEARTYQKVLLKDGVPVGILTLGNRQRALAFKRAIDHRVNLTPIASRCFAEDFALQDWLDAQGVPPAILGVTREGTVAVHQATGATFAGATVLGVAPAVGARFIAPPPVTEALLAPLTQIEGIQAFTETRLSKTKVITVGRQAGASLLIDHSSISRRHAEISYSNGQYVLRDLGSTNGTFVNDVRLEPNSLHILQPEERVRFGSRAAFAFQMHTMGGQTIAPSAHSQGPKTALHEMRTGFYDPSAAGQILPSGQPILNADGSLLLPGANSAVPAAVVATLQESPALIVVTQGKPEVFLLKQGKRITLGRDKGNTIVLAEIAASRLHAEVTLGPDGFYIRDMESNNGVIVNQAKIDNPNRLAHGDRITIGSILIYFMQQCPLDSSHAPARADISQGQSGICRNCGIANTRIARFCANCGAPMGAVNIS